MCLLCPRTSGSSWEFVGIGSKAALGWFSLLGLKYLTVALYTLFVCVKYFAKVLFCRIRCSDSQVPCSFSELLWCHTPANATWKRMKPSALKLELKATYCTQ